MARRAFDHHRKGSQVVRLSPDGAMLLVIGDHEPVVSLIDPKNGAQRPARVGAKPMDGAFHPDGTTFLLANEGDGTLSEIDLRTATILRTVPVGTGCETLAYFRKPKDPFRLSRHRSDTEQETLRYDEQSPWRSVSPP